MDASDPLTNGTTGSTGTFDTQAARALLAEWASNRFMNFDSHRIIEALGVLFPERSPALDDSEAKIRYDSGARSVVRLLEHLRYGH